MDLMSQLENENYRDLAEQSKLFEKRPQLIISWVMDYFVEEMPQHCIPNLKTAQLTLPIFFNTCVRSE